MIDLRCRLGLGVLVMLVGSRLTGLLAAQVPAAIAPTALAQQRDALAADSLRDRVTPSPALERTAQYVATQFQHFGLSRDVGKDETFRRVDLALVL